MVVPTSLTSDPKRECLVYLPIRSLLPTRLLASPPKARGTLGSGFLS